MLKKLRMVWKTYTTRWLACGLVVFTYAVEAPVMLQTRNRETGKQTNPAIAPPVWGGLSSEQRRLLPEMTEVTDDDLLALRHAVQLRSLRLDGSKLTDAGLAHLAALPALSDLSLRNTQVTDDGLAQLERLETLQSLDLAGTQITDTGLRHLAGLSRLFRLDLSHTPVGDAGIPYLTSLNRLLILSLDSTSITDRGLDVLKRLPSLASLNLWRTSVTSDGIADLQRALPNLHVSPTPEDQARYLSAIAQQRRNRDFRWIFIFVFPVVVLGGALASQLKQQFADARARLLPGFALPHLLVPALLCGLGVVAWSIWAAWCLKEFTVGPLSVATLFFGAAAWCVYTNSQWLRTVIMLAWFGTILMGRHIPMESVAESLSGFFPVFLLIGAWAAIGALVIRLVHLHEEMPEYGKLPPQVGWNVSSWFSQKESAYWQRYRGNRSWVRHLLIDRPLDRLKGYHENSFGQQIHLWRSAIPMKPGVIGLSLAGFSILLASWDRFFFSSDPSIAVMLCLFLLAMPYILVVQLWRQEWDRMAWKSLLPLSRSRLIQGLFAASILDTMELCFPTVLGAVASFAIVGGTLPPITLAGSLAFVALFVACWTLMLGTGLCLFSFRRSGALFLLHIVFPMLLFLAPAILVHVLSPIELTPELVTWLSAILALAGIGLMNVAYWRWCRVELG